MNAKSVWLASFLLASVGGAMAFSQEKKAAPAGASTDDMKMKEFATPGPAHKALDAKIGKWNVQVKTTMAPGEAPETSTGTSEMKWILGGRFVEESFSGTFMGEPFQGRGTSGYDNIKKKYVSTWIDTMGTGIIVGEGTFDAGTKTFQSTSDCPDAAAWKYVKARSVDKMVDNDHFMVQMFTNGPDGKEFMSMELHYTRAK
jgi:hypothetical protein